MYSSFQLLKKYISYWFHASNGKGHGVHSPFVFDFITSVLHGQQQHPDIKKIESLRKALRKNDEKIEVVDFGAGSTTHAHSQRAVSQIARTALKSPKYAQLLYRMAAHYQCKNVMELGTSLGLTTSYLALSGAEKVVSFEGSPSISALAQQHFDSLNINNIDIIEGNVDLTLPNYLESSPQIDLAFIDANHRAEPTIAYFNHLLKHAHEQTIFVFDDIHWSSDMETAWRQIQSHEKVTMTIDLFFFGIVLIKKDFKEPQHFRIRF